MRQPVATLFLSEAGLDLIAESEGFVGHLYDDAAGHATVGFGHLVHRGPVTPADRVGPSGRGITEPEALLLLRRDARKAQEAVREHVAVPLSQGEFDALVSFTFNLGGGALAGSTLLRLLNAEDRTGAAGQFGRWTRAGGKVLPGLVKRRERERAMFLG